MSPRDDFSQDPFSQDPAMADGGEQGAATRRLSDKILSAFSHAYAVGETEIARQLRAALVASEAGCGGSAEQRRDYDPLGQADLWVAFVEARDGYKRARTAEGDDGAAVAVALDAMKAAYRRWSEG